MFVARSAVFLFHLAHDARRIWIRRGRRIVGVWGHIMLPVGSRTTSLERTAGRTVEPRLSCAKPSMFPRTSSHPYGSSNACAALAVRFLPARLVTRPLEGADCAVPHAQVSGRANGTGVIHSAVAAAQTWVVRFVTVSAWTPATGAAGPSPAPRNGTGLSWKAARVYALYALGEALVVPAEDLVPRSVTVIVRFPCCRDARDMRWCAAIQATCEAHM